MNEAPPFWFAPAGVAAWMLSPLASVYSVISSRRMQRPSAAYSNAPVLCVGNLIAGGAGKTPTAIAIAKIARQMGLRPGFLSRGYGSSSNSPTLVDIKQHSAHDVGDEPLILALYANTVVSPDRPAGAAMLEAQDVDLIIMDDGFQNPSLHKDYSLIVVDAGRGIGNGFCIPAGPLRAGLQTQLAAATAVLLIGRSDAGTQVVRRCARIAKPVLSAGITVRKPAGWQDLDVLAYSGIADPSKFHASLTSVGANVVASRSFHDHHPFSAEECRELLAEAREKDLTLVTTEKDSVRLVRAGTVQQELRSASKTLFIDLGFENPKLVEMAIQTTVDRANSRKI